MTVFNKIPLNRILLDHKQINLKEKALRKIFSSLDCWILFYSSRSSGAPR